MKLVQVKAWEEKVSALAEEQTKHRTALESELKNLKANQEEMASALDASLLSLQEVRPRLCLLLLLLLLSLLLLLLQ